MTKKEFKFAMQRGLGRCIAELKGTDDIEKYQDLVMWGCTHELAYDAQCEGSRSAYLYEMIREFPNAGVFLQAAAERMEKCVHTPGWEFSQCCQLLALFAGEGNEFAVCSLQCCYESLLDLLKQKGKKNEQGIFPERDNFEELCISIATYSSDISDCRKNYLSIVKDMGALIKENPLFMDWTFDWFQAACEGSLGETYVKKVLRNQAKHIAEVQDYLASLESMDAVGKEKSEKRYEDPARAEEIYKQLCDGKQVDLEIRPVLMRGLQRSGQEHEVRKLGIYYASQTQEQVRVQLLKLLANKDCAYALDVDMLIADSKAADTKLQEYAFRALGLFKDERICEYALELLSDPERKADAVMMLAKNYQEKNKALFEELVKSMPISYKEGEWHGVFSSVMDIFEDKSVKNPPKELLYYMYENTLCSFCRSYIVKEMGRRRMLTDEILQECQYDSNQEIREYAKRKMQKQKTALQRFLSRESKVVDNAEAERLLQCFQEKFVLQGFDPDNKSRSWLLWCNLNCAPRKILTEDFDRIPFDSKKEVYFYDERSLNIYHVTFGEIRRLVAKLEPWEEIDAEIFDDSFVWFVAITHEDIVLLYGL